MTVLAMTALDMTVLALLRPDVTCRRQLRSFLRLSYKGTKQLFPIAPSRRQVKFLSSSECSKIDKRNAAGRHAPNVLILSLRPGGSEMSEPKLEVPTELRELAEKTIEQVF